ncbi:helix-turn-helix transcriptional regulator [Gordonia paraffinivorans]|uniref:helix-turn-helix transcriptional regulator n=1 Tax=Gordonia paraffinivorans TaxID=175628 RepID=UPI0035583AD6
MFSHDAGTVFAVEVDGASAGTIHVHRPVTAAGSDAVRAFAAAVGAALGLIGLRSRRSRQQNLYEAMPVQASAIRERSALHSAEPVGQVAVPEHLTRREREVFVRLLAGESNAVIAAELVISVETVKSHVRQILRKCGAANRAELIGKYGPSV